MFVAKLRAVSYSQCKNDTTIIYGKPIQFKLYDFLPAQTYCYFNNCMTYCEPIQLILYDLLLASIRYQYHENTQIFTQQSTLFQN